MNLKYTDKWTSLLGWIGLKIEIGIVVVLKVHSQIIFEYFNLNFLFNCQLID